MISKESFQTIIKDRALVGSFILLIILCIALIVSSFVTIHPNDVQIPVRYSIFGNVTIYRDKWYELISFPLLALIVAGLHTAIAVRLLGKHRSLALGFVLLSCLVVLLAAVVLFAVFNLVNAPL